MAEDAGPAPDPVWRDIRFSRPLRRACPVRLPTCCYIESPPPSVRDGRAESKSRVARDEDWSGTSVLPRVSPGSKPGGFLSSSCPRNRWRGRGGCRPRCLLLDRQASLLFLFATTGGWGRSCTCKAVGRRVYSALGFAVSLPIRELAHPLRFARRSTVLETVMFLLHHGCSRK